MQSVTNCLLKNKFFFSFLVILVVLIAWFTFSMSKERSFIELNFFHNKNLDLFFIGYTYIGDGLFSLFCVVILYLIRQRILALQILLAFLISGLLAQLLKFIFHMPRPLTVFGTEGYRYFINDITHQGYNSFPSGHTTSAFAMATLVCLQIKDWKLQLLVIFAACGVGYSRIYLGQHFLPDVLAGILVGIFSALFVYMKTNQVLRLTKLRPVTATQ